MSKIKVSFSGHDKFDCKIDWIVKGLKAFNENKNMFLSSNLEESITNLGLGINMLKSLKHWLKVMGLINEKELTILGNLILEKDQFLENTDILWILHWNLIKNKEKTTLYYMFFNFIYKYRFSKDEILYDIKKWLEENQIKLSENTLKSDIDVFLKMYVNFKNEYNMSLLTDLNLISKGKDNYVLNIDSHTNISNDVFLYILNDYINMYKLNNNESLSINDIQRGELSIQKSLCISENTLFAKINQLNDLTNGKLTYSETSGIRQIYIKEKLNNIELLNNILNEVN